MVLIVDKPKTSGSGSSNDGNSATKFFNDAQLSEITGIEKQLIENCATLLQALSSGYKINVDKFRKFAQDTARELTSNYFWYLSPSVHKILIHALDVIQYVLVLIGDLFEKERTHRSLQTRLCLTAYF